MKEKELRNWGIGLMIVALLCFIGNPKDGTTVSIIIGWMTALFGFGAVFFTYLEWKMKKKLKSSKLARQYSNFPST